MSTIRNNTRTLSRLDVSGFKSINQEQSIEIKPLTILAGANSSGKSSIMQALLLLKQTFDVNYDPGPLLLNGSNVKFTSTKQFFAKTKANSFSSTLSIGIYLKSGFGAKNLYRRTNKGIDLFETIYRDRSGTLSVRSDMNQDQISDIFQKLNIDKDLDAAIRESENARFAVERLNGFLDVTAILDTARIRIGGSRRNFDNVQLHLAVREIIHIPGWRGNPERAYPVTATGPLFPGNFETYVASIISKWQSEKNEEKINLLGRQLELLGLTWKVKVQSLNETQIEIRVGRLPKSTKGGTQDTVNITDVGFGVSQTLPVVVALLAAKPGQIVYIEQPELHLHPRAQNNLSNLLAEAAKRGVQVVVETHSSLLLLGIQSLIAEGKLDSKLVKLHWFTRPDGFTKIESADLDELGAFGDWPEDFADVSLEAQSRYLDAVDAKQMEE